MLPRYNEEMWCSNCEHVWTTEDYFQETKCPNCTIEPVQIMRTSSTGFFYAYIEKHPEKITEIKQLGEIV